MSKYFITGPWDDSLGEYQYWTPSGGWGRFVGAMECDRSILADPLPHGATGILEVIDGMPTEFYSLEFVFPKRALTTV